MRATEVESGREAVPDTDAPSDNGAHRPGATADAHASTSTTAGQGLLERRLSRVLVFSVAVLLGFFLFNLSAGKYLTAAVNVVTASFTGIAWVLYRRNPQRFYLPAAHLFAISILASVLVTSLLNGRLDAEGTSILVVGPFGASLIFGYRRAAWYAGMCAGFLVMLYLAAPAWSTEPAPLDGMTTLLVSLLVGTGTVYGFAVISGRTQEAQVAELHERETIIRRQTAELESQRDLLSAHNDDLAVARDEAVRNALELEGARKALEDMNLLLEQQVAARTAALLRNRGDIDAAALADEVAQLRSELAQARSVEREAAATNVLASVTPLPAASHTDSPQFVPDDIAAPPEDGTAASADTGPDPATTYDKIDLQRTRNVRWALMTVIVAVLIRAATNLVSGAVVPFVLDIALGATLVAIATVCRDRPERWKLGRHIVVAAIALSVCVSAWNMGPLVLFLGVPIALFVIAVGTSKEAIVWTVISASLMLAMTAALTIEKNVAFDYPMLGLQLSMLILTSVLAVALQHQLRQTITDVEARGRALIRRNAELAHEHAVAVAARRHAEAAEAEAVRTNAALEGAQAALRSMAQGLEDRVTERTAELILANGDLEAERDTLTEVMAAVPFGLFVLAADGALSAQNDEAAGLFGGPLLDADDLSRRLDLDLSVLVRYGESFVDEDRHATNLKGSVIPVAVLVQPICSDDGSHHGAVVAVRDMSQARQAELESRHADKLADMGRLAAGIAHEINTPMQYVRDNLMFSRDTVLELVSGLPDGSIDPFLAEELPLALDQAVTGVDRVAEIVRAVKTFSHPGSETPEPADLNAALHSTATVARNETKYVADVDLDLDPDLPRVTCWIGDLNQVFLNLVVNAAHAIGDSGAERGTITIATRYRPDTECAIVTISDDGCGMPADVRAKIFEPFFTTKEAGRGTGQGLPLAKRLVEKHGGTIAVDSEEGHGTTFTVWIPMQATVNE